MLGRTGSCVEGFGSVGPRGGGGGGGGLGEQWEAVEEAPEAAAARADQVSLMKATDLRARRRRALWKLDRETPCYTNWRKQEERSVAFGCMVSRHLNNASFSQSVCRVLTTHESIFQMNKRYLDWAQ